MSDQVIDQDGTPQVYLAHYWRHLSEYWDAYDNPDDAKNVLWFGGEEGHLAACCVIDPTGRSRTVEDDGTGQPILAPMMFGCPSEKKRSESTWTS